MILKEEETKYLDHYDRKSTSKGLLFVPLVLLLCSIVFVEGSQPSLRGHEFMKVARRLENGKTCKLFEIYNEEHKRCVQGMEYGEKCGIDSDCFTGFCSAKSQKCDCPLLKNCIGCHSKDAVCLRLEQSLHKQIHNVKVDDLIAYGRNKEGEGNNTKAIRMFSKSAHNDEGYEAMFMKHGYEPKPPVFVQSNAGVSDLNDIIKIEILGETTGIMGSQVFGDGHWIKSISKEDISYMEEDGVTGVVTVQVWPRLTSQQEPGHLISSSLIVGPQRDQTSVYNKMWVYEISEDIEINFDIPSNMGFEFIGESKNATIYISSEIRIEGRVSFKNVTVTFSSGSMHILPGSSVIFQSCEMLVNELHCPRGFTKIDGLCFHTTEIEYHSSYADKACVNLPRGFLPTKADIAFDFAKESFKTSHIFRESQSAWITSVNTLTKCTSIDSMGKVQTTPTSSSFCDELKPFLCAAKPKEFITGYYTSYFSSLIIGTYQELVDRLYSDNLPNSLGSIVNLVDMENLGKTNQIVDDSSENLSFNVSDTRPIAVTVKINLKEGNDSDIHVAVDTSDIISKLYPHEWNLHDGSWLPSKVQVHATAQVCVASVDLYFRNQTGVDNKAFTISAEMFSDCLGMNVCSKSNEDKCSRSLMYYNEEKKCAMLARENAKYLRDLSFNLYDGHCDRLTSWNHPNLGEKLVLEMYEYIDNENTRQDSIVFQEILSDVHKYDFTPLGDFSENRRELKLTETNSSKSALFLRPCSVLPTSVMISGGSGGRVKMFRIARYNQTISSVDFRSLLNCKNTCSKFADEDGLLLDLGRGASTVSLDLSKNGCGKLIEVETRNITGRNDKNGRSACSSPTREHVSTLGELHRYLDILSSENATYRSLHVSIPPSGFHEIGTIVVPENRILRISNTNQDSDAMIDSIRFIVPSLAELYLEDLALVDRSSIIVLPQGLLSISGGWIKQMTDFSTPFLKNEGSLELGGVEIIGPTLLENARGGDVELSYVHFAEEAQLINWGDRGSVAASNLLVHDNFDLDSITLPDTALSYTEVYANDTLCNGRDIPNITISLDATSCFERCDNEFLCSGVLLYNDVDNGPRCGLCLSEKECAFDCSKSSAIYWKAESNFRYTKITSCSVGSRSISNTTDLITLEECKLRCSYYKACEGFILASNRSCQLVADLDLSSKCNNEEEEQIYIAYDSNHQFFAHVSGELIEKNETKLAIYLEKEADECSTICIMTLHCASFVLERGSCVLYGSAEYKRSEKKGLYIFIGDTFPKKRYMQYMEQLPIIQPIRSYTTKTRERCSQRCDEHFFCMALTYWPYSVRSKNNCELFDYNIEVDEVNTKEVLDPASRKKYDKSTMLFAYMFDTYVPSSGDVFVEEVGFSDLHFEECKSLCLYDVDCTAVRYFPSVTNNTQSNCILGFLDEIDASFSFTQGSSMTLSSGLSENTEQYFVLEAKPFYSDIKYEKTAACYTGQPLVRPKLEPEISSGYTRFENTCISGSVTNLTAQRTGPVACASLCSRTLMCDGFVHYVDYGGTLDRDKIGLCGLLSSEEEIGIGSCDETQHNMDIYLRGDMTLACQAACSVNKKCTSFAFDEFKGCLLYSEIALLRSISGSCETERAIFQVPKLVGVNKQYREKEDALVAIPGHCFKEMNDDADIGCFSPFLNSNTVLAFQNRADLTRQLCKKQCEERGNEFYLIHAGSSCYCSDSDMVYKDLTASSNCTIECPGDSRQTCGGLDSVFVGSTNTPKINITLSQCRRKCSDLSSCRGVFFSEDSNGTICAMKSTALVDECTNNDPSGLAFIQSFERYYESFEGGLKHFDILHKSKEDCIDDCKKLCDSFSFCDAIRFKQSNLAFNCEILGRGDLSAELTRADRDIYVVHDAVSFTKFPSQPETEQAIMSFENVYHIDECLSICKAHTKCGSFTFEPKSCILYGFWTYSDIDDRINITQQVSLSNYYVDHGVFAGHEPRFLEVPPGFCVASKTFRTHLPMISSSYECAKRCLFDEGCEIFTYEEGNEDSCLLFDESTTLIKGCGNNSLKTYVLYNPEFIEMEFGCLDVEESYGHENLYRILSTSLIECAALCDHWIQCNSFRFDKIDESCNLFKSFEHKENCAKNVSIAGILYVPSWAVTDEFATTNEMKCPTSDSDEIIVSNITKEACIMQCVKIGCGTIEHTQNSDCIMLTETKNCSRTKSFQYQSGSSNLIQGDRGTGRSLIMKHPKRQKISNRNTRNLLSSRKLASSNSNVFFANTCMSCQTLLSRTERLSSEVARKLPTIIGAQQTIGQVNNMINQINGPISDLRRELSSATSLLTSFSNVCMALEFIPYVGKIVKGLRLRKITSSAKSTLSNGNTKLGHVDSKFDTMRHPIQSFETALPSFTDAIQNFIRQFEAYAMFLVQLARCVHESQLASLFSKIKSTIDALSNLASNSLNFLQKLFSMLSVLDGFITDVNGKVLRHLQTIDNKMSGFFRVLRKLSFLDTIMNYRICIPYPAVSAGIRWKRKCVGRRWWRFCFRIPIPYIRIYWRHYCLSLNDVGRWMNDMKRKIMRIPLIGWLWSTVESILNKILSAIFPRIELPIPDLNINVNFVDNVQSQLRSTIQSLESHVNSFESFLDLGGLLTLVTKVANDIKSKLGLNFNLDDLNFDCDDIECMKGKISSILGIEMDQLLDYPEEMIEMLENVVDHIDEIGDVASKWLTADKIECSSYKNVEINVLGQIKKNLGLENSDIPECPISIDVCNDIEFIDMEDFAEEMMSLFQRIGVVAEDSLHPSATPSESPSTAPSVTLTPYAVSNAPISQNKQTDYTDISAIQESDFPSFLPSVIPSLKPAIESSDTPSTLPSNEMLVQTSQHNVPIPTFTGLVTSSMSLSTNKPSNYDRNDFLEMEESDFPSFLPSMVPSSAKPAITSSDEFFEERQLLNSHGSLHPEINHRFLQTNTATSTPSEPTARALPGVQINLSKLYSTGLQRILRSALDKLHDKMFNKESTGLYFFLQENDEKIKPKPVGESSDTESSDTESSDTDSLDPPEPTTRPQAEPSKFQKFGKILEEFRSHFKVFVNGPEEAELFLLLGLKISDDGKTKLDKVSLRIVNLFNVGVDIIINQNLNNEVEKAVESKNKEIYDAKRQSNRNSQSSSSEEKKKLKKMLKEQMEEVTEEINRSEKKAITDCVIEYIETTEKIYKQYTSNNIITTEDELKFGYWKIQWERHTKWKSDNINEPDYYETLKKRDEIFRSVLLDDFTNFDPFAIVKAPRSYNWKTGFDDCSGLDSLRNPSNSVPDRSVIKNIMSSLKKTSYKDIWSSFQTLVSETVKFQDPANPHVSVFNKLKNIIQFNWCDHNNLPGSAITVQYVKKYVFGGFRIMENEFDLMHLAWSMFSADHGHFIFSTLDFVSNYRAINNYMKSFSYEQYKPEEEVKDHNDILKQIIAYAPSNQLYLVENHLKISVDMGEMIFDIYNPEPPDVDNNWKSYCTGVLQRTVNNTNSNFCVRLGIDMKNTDEFSCGEGKPQCCGLPIVT